MVTCVYLNTKRGPSPVDTEYPQFSQGLFTAFALNPLLAVGIAQLQTSW